MLYSTGSREHLRQSRKLWWVACLLAMGIAMPVMVTWKSCQVLQIYLENVSDRGEEKPSGRRLNCDNVTCSFSQQKRDAPTTPGPEHDDLKARLLQILADDNQSYVPPNTPGAFIHLGKCGGSTLSHQLRNGCHSFAPKPCRPNVMSESYISRLTTYVHTPDMDKLGRPDWMFDFYAVTSRDPLERFMSAFVFMHPENKLWETRQWRAVQQVYDCFPTMDSFAEKLGNDFDNHQAYNLTRPWEVDASNCTLLARAILANRVSVVEHFHYDTKFVWHQLPLDKPVLVMRKEYLWHDWVAANQWLGQEDVATFPDVQIRDFSNHTLRVGKTLSTEGRRRLCLALEREYRAYWDIIARAVNLLPAQKAATYLQSLQSCPELQSPTII